MVLNLCVIKKVKNFLTASININFSQRGCYMELVKWFIIY